jgi:hypothetical protein
MVIYEYEATRGALNLSSTNYLDLPYQGNIPMVEPGIEPETS